MGVLGPATLLVCGPVYWSDQWGGCCATLACPAAVPQQASREAQQAGARWHLGRTLSAPVNLVRETAPQGPGSRFRVRISGFRVWGSGLRFREGVGAAESALAEHLLNKTACYQLPTIMRRNSHQVAEAGRAPRQCLLLQAPHHVQ